MCYGVVNYTPPGWAALNGPWGRLMDESNGDRRSTGAVERHIQTILIAVVTGAIMYSASYIYNDNRGAAVQQTQLEVLTAQVIEMRADLKALQFNYVKHTDFKDLETRVRALEQQRNK